MRRSLAVVLFILLAVGCATKGAAAPGSEAEPVAISWKNPLKGENTTYIDGSLRAPFGLFIITWRIDAAGKVTLADEQPSGTGEMPIYDKTPLFPWLPGNGKAYLFRVWLPVLGNRDPISLRLVAVVSEDELFAGLGKVLAERSDRKYPSGLKPSGSRAPMEVTEWNASGLSWRMSGNGQTRLYALKSSGELVEAFPWILDSAPDAPSESLVFEVRTLKVEDISLELLNCRLRVNTARMLSAR